MMWSHPVWSHSPQTQNSIGLEDIKELSFFNSCIYFACGLYFFHCLFPVRARVRCGWAPPPTSSHVTRPLGPANDSDVTSTTERTHFRTMPRHYSPCRGLSCSLVLSRAFFLGSNELGAWRTHSNDPGLQPEIEPRAPNWMLVRDEKMKILEEFALGSPSARRPCPRRPACPPLLRYLSTGYWPHSLSDVQDSRHDDLTIPSGKRPFSKHISGTASFVETNGTQDPSLSIIQPLGAGNGNDLRSLVS